MTGGEDAAVDIGERAVGAEGVGDGEQRAAVCAAGCRREAPLGEEAVGCRAERGDRRSPPTAAAGTSRRHREPLRLSELRDNAYDLAIIAPGGDVVTPSVFTCRRAALSSCSSSFGHQIQRARRRYRHRMGAALAEVVRRRRDRDHGASSRAVGLSCPCVASVPDSMAKRPAGPAPLWTRRCESVVMMAPSDVRGVQVVLGRRTLHRRHGIHYPAASTPPRRPKSIRRT